jgi:hypothetical protein
MAAQKPKLGTIALVVALVAILAGALWYAASAWVMISGPPMPAVGYVAMTFGIVISLVVGCGLMALLFYSSRQGYDEPHRAVLGEVSDQQPDSSSEERKRAPASFPDPRREGRAPLSGA